MTPKRILKNLRDRYVLGQVDRADIPQLPDVPVKRYHIVFSGRVQGVGFRFEYSALARRLELTGWIQNLPDGSVAAEIQGSDERIGYLEDFMASLTRIHITGKTKTPHPPDPAERSFCVL